MFADKVKPNGRVIGVDFSPELIEYAVNNLGGEPLKDIIQFQLADVCAIPFEDNSFDTLFCGNCFSYLTNRLELLEEQKRVTKKGGRVVAKDFDGVIIIVHPIEPHLSLKVMAAAAQALKENPPNPPFDNIVGRKLHGMFLQAGFKDVSTVTVCHTETVTSRTVRQTLHYR